MNKEIIIRNTQKTDFRVVENLIRDCFFNVYQPGCLEHYVIKNLRESEDYIEELDFVIEKNGQIIGQNIFAKAELILTDGSLYPILTMGPVCIDRAFQNNGYGKMLIEYGLEEAGKLGYKAVCFEGDIRFYKKCGFDYAYKKNISYHDFPKDKLCDFLMLKELQSGALDGISGEYRTPEIYFCAMQNKEDFEEFEKTFPYKEKLKLPSQLF